MVCCDGCGQWYHAECVQISAEEESNSNPNPRPSLFFING